MKRHLKAEKSEQSFHKCEALSAAPRSLDGWNSWMPICNRMTIGRQHGGPYKNSNNTDMFNFLFKP